MNNNDTGFTDPFANMDDGFGDDDLGYGLDDGLSDPNNQGQNFGEELPPLDTSADFDEYGDPIVHTAPQNQFDGGEDAGHNDSGYVDQPASAQASKPEASKPFLKTPIGMIAAGAGAVMLVGIVGAVVSSMSGSDETLTEALPQAPEPIAPVAGDPNYNANTLPTQSGAAVPVEQKPAAPIAQQEPAPQAQSAPVVEHAGGSTLQSQMHARGLDESPTIDTSDEVARLKAALTHQREETAELKSAIATLNQGLAKLSAYAEKDHAEQSEIKGQLEELSKRIEEAPKVADKSAAESAVTLPSSKPAVTVNVDGQKATVKPANEGANPNAPGRYRLPGLKVVEVTESGKMAVVTKTSNGRTYTMFKGERLGTPRGSMTVTEVKDGGFLILVGDIYYIDKVAEDKPDVPPVKPVAKVEKPVKRIVSAPVKQKDRAPTQSTSYTLNAVYDSGTSFGLVNSAGDFKSYRVGDELPGAGRITGLDENGNLRAGDKVIKSLY